MRKLIDFFANIYNKIEHYWESETNHRILGTAIVLSFIFSILVIQLNLWGIFPESIRRFIPHNHFAAIEVAFLVLLSFEVLSLIFTLPSSVAKSLHKQFEIISLILLRNAFKEFSHFTEPIQWDTSISTITHVFADSFSSIFIFFGIFMIRRIRISRQITFDEDDQFRFTQIKKFISVLLLLSFVLLAIQDGYLFINQSHTYKFFPVFYTILIFTDILMVLVSLRYNYNYMILFRNSGFALATVMLRLSLNAPVYYNAIIAIAAIIFVFLLTLVYQKMNKLGMYASNNKIDQ
jgi:hypothetical protein